jgi:hypothetical protein
MTEEIYAIKDAEGLKGTATSFPVNCNRGGNGDQT